MNRSFPSPSSVTRWLLVVFGCAVLETAQPMIAAPASESESAVKEAAVEAVPAPNTGPGLAADTVIYPAGSTGASEPKRRTSSGGGTWLFAAAVCLGAAGWVYWKKRYAPIAPRRGRSLVVEETRALGNRQFLVVAVCDGKRFLIGVAPGCIRLVSPLDAKEAVDDNDE